MTEVDNPYYVKDVMRLPLEERVKILFDALRAQEAAGLFNMEYWNQPARPGNEPFRMFRRDRTPHTCGTVACIGGTIELIISKYTANPPEYLGITSIVADRLFYPTYRIDIDWKLIGVEDAIKATELAMQIPKSLSNREARVAMDDIWTKILKDIAIREGVEIKELPGEEDFHEEQRLWVRLQKKY